MLKLTKQLVYVPIYQGIGAKIMSIEQVDLQAPPAPLVFTDAAAESARFIN